MTRLREVVLRHLWKRFPQHCVILTDPLTRRAIDAGIERAASHRFRDDGDVRAFVMLMVLLGSHFDEDPQLPWAGEHLRRTEGATRREAMIGLLAATSAQMEPVIGRNGEYYRYALTRAAEPDFEEIAATYDGSDDSLRAMLRHLHWRKFQALGDERVERMLADARAATARHGLTTPPGIVVYLALMFLLGSAIDSDPFHPWVNQTLAYYGGIDPDELARLFHAEATGILRRYARLDRVMRGGSH